MYCHRNCPKGRAGGAYAIYEIKRIRCKMRRSINNPPIAPTAVQTITMIDDKCHSGVFTEYCSPDNIFPDSSKPPKKPTAAPTQIKSDLRESTIVSHGAV